MITFDCGCVNDIDMKCFAQFSVSKCAFHTKHQREIGGLGEDYYAKLGLAPGSVQRYEREFLDGFGPPCTRPRSRDICEIGCGVSPYVPMLHRYGWRYTGVEPSRFACDLMMRMYPDAAIINKTIECVSNDPPVFYGAILSCHSLEHMHDPRAALIKMHEMLDMDGNLYLCIPDDTDLWNPDHLWFFNPASIRRLLDQTGFRIESMNLRRHTEVENYIYIVAENRS